MNSVVEFYRQQRPDDPRSDDEITLDYGDQVGVERLADYPDFVEQYQRLEKERRIARAPSLAGEVSAGFSRGVEGLKSTAYGAGALASEAFGATNLRNRLLERSAAAQDRAGRQYAPTIKGVEDIGSISEGIRYLAGAAGEVTPSLAEATVAAAAGGGLGGLIARRAAKEAIDAGVKKATAETIRSQVAKNAAKWGAITSSAANSFGLSTGEIYTDLSNAKDEEGNPTIDPDTAFNVALAGGAIAAIPDTFLPAYVVGKFFKGATTDTAKKAAHNYVMRLLREAPKTAGLEAGTEAFQEFVNIASEKYADPEKRDTPISRDEWTRIANAAALGAVGGGVVAPISAAPRPGTGTGGMAAGNQPIQETEQPQPAVGEQRIVPPPRTPEQREQDKLTASYASPTEQELFDMEQMAKRELAGLSLEDMELLTRQKQIWERSKLGKYNLILESLRTTQEESNATQVRQEQESVPAERVGTDPVVPPIGEDRQEQAEVPQESTQPSVSRGLREKEGLITPSRELEIIKIIRSGNHDEINSALEELPINYGDTGQYPRALFLSLQARSETDPGLSRSVFVGPNSLNHFIENVSDRTEARARARTAISELTFAPASLEPSPQLPAEPVVPVEPEGISSLASTAVPPAVVEAVPETLEPTFSVDQIDFEGSRVAAKPTRQGQGPAIPAFADTESVSAEVFKERVLPRLPTSGTTGKSSRGVIVFRVGNTGEVLITNAFQSGPKERRSWKVGLKVDGKNNYDHVTQAMELTPIGVMTLTEPVTDWSVRMPEAQYRAEIRDPAMGEMAELLSAAEASVEMQESQLDPASRVTIKTRQDMGAERAKKNVRPPGKLKPEEARALVDGIGQPRWSNWEEFGQQISDALLLNPSLEGALLRAFRQEYVSETATEDATTDGLYAAFRPIYEAYQTGLQSSLEGEALAEAVVRNIGGIQTPSGDTGNSQSNARTGTAAEAAADVQERRERAKTARNRFRTPNSGYVTSGKIREAWRRTTELLSNSGVNLKVYQARLDGLSAEFFAHASGGYFEDKGGAYIQLVVQDLLYPSQEDLTAALHETVHWLYGMETPEMQARIQKAIDRLGPKYTKLRQELDARIQSVLGQSLSSDRLAEEVLAEALAMEGFTPQESQSIAQAIWRFLKDLYLRAAIAIQEGLFGAGNANPNLAMEYMRNRLQTFLAGDAKNMPSWMTRLAGGKPNLAQQARYYTPADGGGWVPEFWDYRTGTLVYEDVVPDNPQSAAFNITGRFRFPTTVTQPEVLGGDNQPGVRASIDIAANNAFASALRSMYEQSGYQGAFEQWATDVAGLSTTPAANIEATLAALQGLDNPGPIPPATTTINDLRSDAFKGQASAKAIKMMNALRSSLDGKRSEASNEIKAAQARWQSQVDRMNAVRKRYTDAAFMASVAQDEVRRLVNGFESDVKNELDMAHRLGVVTQQLKELEKGTDVPRQYQDTINRLARKIQANSAKFMDLLLEFASIDFFDWSAPMSDRNGQPGLFTLIQSMAMQNPTLKAWGLDEDTKESRALASILSSFAKTNEASMAWLEIRQANKAAEALQIQQMLDQAVKDTTDDLRVTRATVRNFGSLSRQAGVLLDRYQKQKAKFKAMIEETHENEQFVAYHDAMAPVLRFEIDKMEDALGAGRGWEPYQGADMMLPPAPDTPMERVAANKVKFDWSASPETLRSWINQMDAWLKANEPQLIPSRSATWVTVYDQARKLKMMQANTYHQGVRSTWIGGLMGGSANQLLNTGLATGKAIATRLRRYDSNIQAFTKENVDAGVRVAKAKGDAMKALQIDSTDYFQRTFRDNVFKYIEQRKDVMESENAPEAILREIRNYLLNNPDTRIFMEREGAWAALEKYYRRNAEANRTRDNTRRQMGLKVEDPVLNLFREPIGDSAFTFPRGLNGNIQRVYQNMRDKWNGTGLEKLTPSYVQERLTTDPEGFAEELAERFTPEVWNEFAKPLANLPAQAAFSGQKIDENTWSLANVESVQQAFAQSGGDVLQFARILNQIEGETTETEAEFVAETLSTFQNYFNEIEDIYKRQEERGNQTFGFQNTAHEFMDARISESFPGEWLTYPEFDQNNAVSFVHKLSYHAAFGIDGVALRSDFQALNDQLASAVTEYADIEKRLVQANLGRKVSQKVVDEEVKRIGATKPGGAENYLRYLKNAQKHAQKVQTAEQAVESHFRMESEHLLELRPLTTALRSMTGFMLQSPKSALQVTMGLFDTLIKSGLSKTALRNIRYNFEEFFREAAGSLYQTFSSTLDVDNDAMRRRLAAGLRDSSTRTNFIEKWAAYGLEDSTVNMIAKRASALSQVNVPTATPAEQRVYGTVRPLAPFSTVSSWMDSALALGTWRTYDDLVKRAVDYFQANPLEAANPEFTLEASHLGYDKGFFLNDAEAFAYLKERLTGYGMTLEGLARAAIERNDGTMFTSEQDRLLATMAMSEVSLNSGLSNSPTWLIRNPVLRLATPLLFWPISRMEQLRQAFRGPKGEINKYTVLTGMKVLAAILPLGLAYAWLRDEYDEEILGKKSNIRGFGQDNNFLAAVEQTARVGTLGLWGDLINTAGNFAGEGDLRGLSFDQRIVFANAMLQSLQALSTAAKQGEATYQTVYRPLLMSIGGSGYLQYAQIFNNALGLDNAESRTTARINVSNYLRAAGRELNMDVRVGRGGVSAMPTAIKPWVSEMTLSALANDPRSFNDAYRMAIDAAREEGKPDPEDHVQRSFAAQNPLRAVFRTSPSKAEYQKLLMSLSEDGRRDVSTAINLFNAYADRIGASTFDGKEEKRTASSPMQRRMNNLSTPQLRSKLLERAMAE